MYNDYSHEDERYEDMGNGMIYDRWSRTIEFKNDYTKRDNVITDAIIEGLYNIFHTEQVPIQKIKYAKNNANNPSKYQGAEKGSMSAWGVFFAILAVRFVLFAIIPELLQTLQ